jgi:hypothetical protein
MIAPRPLPTQKIRRSLATALALALMSLMGCTSLRLHDPVAGLSYTPQNVYRALDQLPVHVRRVAVLPMTTSGPGSDLEAGCEMLAPVVLEELGRTRKFEVIRVTPEQLRQLTGRSVWPAEAALPPDFLKGLSNDLDCDAVLFCRLTQFRAYPPLVVGLGLKLVEVDKAEFIWAVDEVFDANQGAVVTGARRFQQSRESLPPQLADSRSILNSPRNFGRYVANSVFHTLPAR